MAGEPAASVIEALGRARTRGERLARTAVEGVDDEAAGYEAQWRLHGWLRAQGWGRRTGWKVGATTRVMQELLAIDHPCAGGVLANRVFEGNAELPFAELCRPGIECEIAVRLGADLPAGSAPYDAASVRAHVATVMAAMELVDDRYDDFRGWPVAALIADDFFQSAAVLGPETALAPDLDLGRLEGITRLDGREAGRGLGAEVMGDPLAALAWLANRFAELGQELRAGDFVLTGSLVAVQWLEAPMRAETEIVGLGKVGLNLT
jgi:2-oxo-3-hexenedioate decarboxylase/2-keto-4-pentenoate hydratase